MSSDAKPLSRRDIRALALNILYAADRSDYVVSLESIIDDFKRGFEIDIPDDSFATQLAKGVLENKYQLDDQIKPFLKGWELERISLCTRIILRMAFWELSQPGVIPVVVINEAVELAKGFAETDAYKFVNGVLDEFVKNYGQQQ